MDEMKDMLAGMRSMMEHMHQEQQAQREADAAKPSKLLLTLICDLGDVTDVWHRH